MTDQTAAIYDAIDAFQRTHRLPGLQHAQIRGLLAEHLARALPTAPAGQAPATDRAGLMRAHVALAEQAGRDQAAIARVRRLHDQLETDTGLASPDDEITRGAAARKIAAALDGWTPPVDAVLPAPADRAAVMREAADALDAYIARYRSPSIANWTGAVAFLRRMAVEAQQPTPPSEDCTCIPFTRQNGVQRYCQPGDTVDMISGWEIGGDCPHHRDAVNAQQPEARS